MSDARDTIDTRFVIFLTTAAKELISIDKTSLCGPGVLLARERSYRGQQRRRCFPLEVERFVEVGLEIFADLSFPSLNNVHEGN